MCGFNKFCRCFREVKLDHFGKFVKNMDDSIRHLTHISENLAKKMQGRKNFKTFPTQLHILLLVL